MLHFQTSCKYINIRNLVLTLVKPLIFSGQNFVDLSRVFERSTWEYTISYVRIDIKLFVLFILNFVPFDSMIIKILYYGNES